MIRSIAFFSWIKLSSNLAKLTANRFSVRLLTEAVESDCELKGEESVGGVFEQVD